MAISHDDRYIEEIDVPTIRLHMDEGRFTELNSVGTRLMAPRHEALEVGPPRGIQMVSLVERHLPIIIIYLMVTTLVGS